MPKPHGGELINRVSRGKDIHKHVNESSENFILNVDHNLRLDIENISSGLYSPLIGPLTQNDYLSVLENGRLSNDIPWTIPIVIDISDKNSKQFSEDDTITLKNNGVNFAFLKVKEKFRLNAKKHSEKIYKTLNSNHPGVAKTYKMEPNLVGGPITVFKEFPGIYPKYRLKPRETRFLFKDKGWRTIAGFQTRNAPHIGHEYVQKTALSFVDGLFINPLIGKKKKGDFRDQVILASYETLIKNYFLGNSATLVTLEMEMSYAGPKEAIHHAIIRKNYGCTHFIVGRDHAGVGGFYDPFEAQEIFENYPDIGILPLFFRNFFHCNKCGGPQNEKICPHGPEDHVNYKGKEIRHLLSQGKRPDETQMRPEVVDAILRFKNPFVT